MLQVIEKMDPSPQQKLCAVDQTAIDQIADSHKDHRHFHIIIVVNIVQQSVQIADIHIYQSVKSKKITVKNINKKTAEKSREQTGLFTIYKAVYHCQDQQKVWNH